MVRIANDPAEFPHSISQDYDKLRIASLPRDRMTESGCKEGDRPTPRRYEGDPTFGGVSCSPYTASGQLK